MSITPPWTDPRCRFALYAAIGAALKSGHPRRESVALALEALVLDADAPGGVVAPGLGVSRD